MFVVKNKEFFKTKHRSITLIHDLTMTYISHKKFDVIPTWNMALWH
jgi:hypothetical protein